MKAERQSDAWIAKKPPQIRFDGFVATLTAEQLNELVAKSRATKSAEATRAIDAGGDFRAACLDAVRRLDAAALEQALERGIVALGHQGFLQIVVAPLAEQVGGLWRDGTITAAHEHFFTASAKAFLGQLNKQFAHGEGMPNLIACTPTGQLHELGGFMAGVAATHLGWRVAYLGAGLPAAEIAGAATQRGAAAVALSIIYPEDDPHLSEELISLRRYLPPEARIIVAAALRQLIARRCRALARWSSIRSLDSAMRSIDCAKNASSQQSLHAHEISRIHCGTVAARLG